MADLSSACVRRQSFRATPARQAALALLIEQRRRSAFASELVRHHSFDFALSDADRAFATRLVYGVISTGGVLDEVLDRFIRSPERIEDAVRDALRLSAYEILFLKKSAYAAVAQGVELVRGVSPAAAGLANAVLRKVADSCDDFPYGDPFSDPRACAASFGFPLWLADRLISEKGFASARDFFAACNEPAPLFIFVNPLKSAGSAADDVCVPMPDGIGESGYTGLAAPSFAEGCIQMSDRRAISADGIRKAIDRGQILVCDAAAQAVACRALPDDAVGSFLEIGCGRGGKTILFQAMAYRRWGAQIEDYLAIDRHGFKTEELCRRARRYGLKSPEVRVCDATRLSDAITSQRRFDMVFIDAPCSGLGTLRRHVEIRWRLRAEDVSDFARQGFDLLCSAAPFVKEGGVLAYSTCTVLAEENTEVVERFLQSRQGGAFELVPIDGRPFFATELTTHGCDAHFLAKMRRVKVSEDDDGALPLSACEVSEGCIVSMPPDTEDGCRGRTPKLGLSVVSSLQETGICYG